MTTVHRAVGDYGAPARITVTDLQDANGQTVDTGTVTLRASGLFEGVMTNDGGGAWHYDPAQSDLSKRGSFLLEVRVDGSQVTVPSKGGWRLSVRDVATSP